jgi:hypothetical protein
MLSLARLLPKYSDTDKIFSEKCRHFDAASTNLTSGDATVTSSERDNVKSVDDLRSDRNVEIFDITLDKGLLGLGFCVDGGVDAPNGPTNITVKRLFKGEFKNFLVTKYDAIS